ncbi:hypothetical protein GV828_02710 [Flavobacterium sp. NST-5]|uniref:DUF3221 domain-containing protein n=1 Tax=Flavobacterium ichthyis TaxID=2698827 RepID=A0ABW9Z9U5_9FLAO|nr:hypothetical protein [Flavobacterium ichthyis]NBL64107.1 hypothetical protein [Flavobacterium ichthyis]
MKNIILMLVVIFMAGCNAKKSPEIKDEVVVTGGHSENEPEKTIVSVTGIVAEINRGKDGYTASIFAENSQTYFATISIPNLTDPKQFREVSIGETITVSGEAWKMEQDQYIVVRELQPKK